MSTSGKRALVTGITGQDGSYLAEFLLEKGYEVHGIIRRSASFNTERLDPIYQDPHESGARLFLHYGDLNDAMSLSSIVRKIKPTEVYNLGAQSHVAVSFEEPEYPANSDALGALTGTATPPRKARCQLVVLLAADSATEIATHKQHQQRHR